MSAPPQLQYRGVTAAPERLPALRRAIGAWAADLGLSSARGKDLELAVYEAMANVARHAYRGAAGPMEVRARHHPARHRIEVSVADRGRWRQPDRRRTGGRGLPLIRGLADDVQIIGTERGTTVSMSWLLSGARSATEPSERP